MITSVGVGAVIGPDTTLIDVSVGDGAHVGRAHAVSASIGERASVEASRRRALPPPVNSSHRWVGQLPTGAPTGTHLIEVRVTDMFGANHVAHRLIRVE